jgi:hypothetical protein
MKSLVIGLTLIIISASTFAGTTPSKQLVEQYIQQEQAEKAINAEIEAYVQQLSADATPEERARIVEYLNASMGWNAIKDQYASLVQKIFTTEELKASIVFLKTPVGASITKKSQHLTQELASLIATNAQQATKQLSSSAPSDGDATPLAGTEIIAFNVEEHNIDGRVYFTGEIENRGKRAARGVQVEVNLFSGGKFVDQYTTYVSGNVAPAATRYFKVSCGCKDSPPAKHDSFKIHVVEGY